MNLYKLYTNIPPVKDESGDITTYLKYLNEHDTVNKMYEWVAKEFEVDEMRQILEHGMVCGFGQLVYYKDTCAFYDKFKDEIWNLIHEYLEQCGGQINMLQFIAGLNGSDSVGSDDQFKNLLCWFAVEETCRMFIDSIDVNEGV